ncbi:hypothetical protein BF14_030710 [Streptomyces griseus]|nr:hypothetical protein BF14_030710 [Streptomyces griseus]RAN20894.1 hypothetical protein A3838_30040 [Streptomyces badius]RAN28823.1 hypothetical protein A3800_30050 [Streptomyces badius]
MPECFGDQQQDPGVDPGGHGHVAVDVPNPGTLRAVAAMNTKSGFRTTAQSLGLRLSHGRACAGAELDQVTTALLASHRRVVLKTDRSAGGHGLHFVSRGDRPPPSSPPPPESRWVVE